MWEDDATSNAANDKLCEVAKAAINRVFKDKSVDPEHAMVNLEPLS